MKKLVFTLTFIYLLCQIYSNSHSNHTNNTNPNDWIEYIKNRNFDEGLSPKYNYSFDYHLSTVKHWLTNFSTITLGQGTNFNEKWSKNTTVALLYSSSNYTISQISHVPNEAECKLTLKYSNTKKILFIQIALIPLKLNLK